MLQENRYYNANEVTRETYYQLPKVFFTKHSKYADMSRNAALAFCFLKDRLQYSIKNNWVDENNNIFFIFTNDELQETMKVKSNKTVVKIKQELERFGLLEQKRMGVNQPNHLYLLQPVVTATDVYEITQDQSALPKSQAHQGSVKSTLPEKASKNQAYQGSVKNTLPENLIKNQAYQGSVENTRNLDKETLDTNKIHTDTHLDFSKNRFSPQQLEEQNTDLVKHVDQIANAKATQPFLNKESLNLIKAFCKTPAEVYRFQQIILNAKNAVVKEMVKNGFDQNTSFLTLENIPDEMTGWLRNYFNRIRQSDTNHKQIKDYEGYLYRSMVNNMNKFVHSCLQSKEK